MTKNVWVQPQTVVQQFVANEAVSACGDSGVNYLFKCDAGGGVWGSVYQETNGEVGLQTTGRNPDLQLSRYEDFLGVPISGYHACQTEHVASTDSDFLDGYYCARGNTRNPVKVIIWKGEYNDDVHCTTNLDMDSWETDRS